jgi:hypothetical protein
VKLLALTGLVAVACAAPTPTPSPSAPPTASPVPSSCCTATPGQSVALSATPLPGPGRELAPGTYANTDFQPSITFTVGAGWTAEQQLTGFFDIQDEPGSLDVVAVQFTRATGTDTAEDAAADIEGRANLAVTAREEVTIGGLSGIRITADTTDPADSDPVIFRPVLNTPPGPISIGSGRRLQVNLFTTPDGVLAILVGGSIAQWDRAVQLSEPVLESVIVGV